MKKMEKFEDASQDVFQATPKSSVKLIKNTKGINWEVKVVQGEENLMDDLMKKAIEVHKALENEFEVKE